MTDLLSFKGLQRDFPFAFPSLEPPTALLFMLALGLML